MQWSERNNPTGSDDKIERLRSLFVIDGTERDSMDVIEFNEALLQLGMNYTTDILLSLLATFDDDGNGKLQFDELASFLRDSSPGKYDFGDIWERMRTALVHEENGHKVHRIGDFDETIMDASAASEESSTGSGIITSEQFLDILTEYNITGSALTGSDIAKLQERFAFQRTGNDVSHINGAKLCAWLQPVNVDRAAKRISKALDSYVQRTKGDKSSAVTNILAKLSEMSLLSGGAIEVGVVAGADLSEVLHEYSVAVSRAEIRAFSTHFGHQNTGRLTNEECKALLNGSVTVAAPVIRRLPSSVAQKKEIEMTIDLVEISGAVLKNLVFNGAYVVLAIGATKVKTAPSNSRHNGTDKRLLDVSGNTILTPPINDDMEPQIFADIFSGDSEISLNKDPGVLCLNPEMLTYRGTKKLVLQIPIKAEHSVVATAKGNQTLSGAEVTVEITALFREAHSSVKSRIRKMTSTDLAQFVLQPLPVDDDDPF